MAEKCKGKGHVIILPYPMQGHINPMLQFGKRLVSKGVKVTFANTISFNNTMHFDYCNSSSIQIQTISDGFDQAGISQAESPEVYLQSLQTVGSKTLAELIESINGSDHENPISAIVYDGFLPWALDVARQFGVAGVAFFTQSCAVNVMYYHVQRGLVPLPIFGPNVSFPGLPLTFRVSEISSFISDYSQFPAYTHLVLNQFSNIDQADWVLCNSFYPLEQEALEWMESQWRIRSIGPTVPSKYLDKRLEDDKDYMVNLFKPDNSICTNWLQNKPEGSVVYVSNGTVAEARKEQIEELAWGLKATNFYFLWVVRASEQPKLPSNFIEETSQKGLVVTWCSQLEVLSNEAIGCFVTHCGFNSVLETLSLGVPVVCMPQWTDQPTNAKYLEDVWKVGVRARVDEKGVVRREEVEFCLREVMEREKGKKLKENAKKWRKLAIEAIDVGGSSDNNLNEFVAKLCNP